MNTKLNWWKAGVAALAAVTFALGWCSGIGLVRGETGAVSAQAAESPAEAGSQSSSETAGNAGARRILTPEKYAERHPYETLHLVFIEPVRLSLVHPDEYRARVDKLLFSYDTLEQGRDAWLEHLRGPEGEHERAMGSRWGPTATVLLVVDFFGPNERACAKLYPSFYERLRAFVRENGECFRGMFSDDETRRQFFADFGLEVPPPTEPENPHAVKALPFWIDRFLRLELHGLEGWKHYYPLSEIAAWGGESYARYGLPPKYHLDAYEVIGFFAGVLENEPALLDSLREQPELWAKLHQMIAECAEERFAKYMIREVESYRKLMEWHEANRPQ